MAVNGYGVCIYGTAAEAQEVVDLWLQDAYRNRAPDPEEYSVVPCRVTLEEGLVWLQA